MKGWKEDFGGDWKGGEALSLVRKNLQDAGKLGVWKGGEAPSFGEEGVIGPGAAPYWLQEPGVWKGALPPSLVAGGGGCLLYTSPSPRDRG